MPRPFVRRALKRAGVAPGTLRQHGGAERPALVWLPGEEPGAPPLDLSAVFGREAPVELEVGTGKGRFLLAEAAEHPERSYLGLEIQADYALFARLRAERLGLKNVLIARIDGKRFVDERLREASLAAMHVFFPDPWPKKRHQKRRLFDAGFAAAAARALAPGAPLRVASDRPGTFVEIREVLDAEAGFAYVPGSNEGWSSGTSYEARFAAAGHPVSRGIWRRR